MTADDALDLLESRDVHAVELAMFASLAVDIQPALLRRIRRRLVPAANALTEALVWSSELASSRTASSLVLREDAVTVLRERLRSRQAQLDAAYQVIEDAHRGSPQILRAEEELAYLGLIELSSLPRAGWTQARVRSRVQQRLEEIIGSIDDATSRRGELLAWASRAIPSLPDRIKVHETALVLRALSQDVPVRSGVPWSEVFPPGPGDAQVKVRWTGSEVSCSTEGEGIALDVPPVEPYVVDVEVAVKSRWRRLGRLAVQQGKAASLPIARQVLRVRLQNLRGEGLSLSRVAPPAPAPKHPWVCVAGTALHRGLPTAETEASRLIGAALAEAEASLITGGFPGVDHLASTTFAARLRADGKQEELKARMVTVTGLHRRPDFEGGSVERHPSLEAEYWAEVERATLVIVIGAAPGTREVALTAGRIACPVYAFAGTNADKLPGARPLGVGTEHSAQEIASRLRELFEASRAVSETTAWAGAELLGRARAYLAPVSLRKSDEIAFELGAEVERVLGLSGRAPNGAVTSQSPPERVIGYLAAQVSPSRDLLPRLLRAVPRELTFAEQFFETRPLWQGLVALDRHRTLTGNTDRLERTLAELLPRLEALTQLDRNGECKALIGRMLATPIGDRGRFEELAVEYEGLRRTMAAGPERTRYMSRLVAQVRAEAKRAGIEGLRIVMMYRRGRMGMRLVALACCAARPDQAPEEVVKDAMRHSRNGFEQWTALLAIQAVVEKESRARSEPFVSELVAALDAPANRINDPDDASRRDLAEVILRAFARTLGIPTTDASSSVRQWLGAPTAVTSPGRVALLGSSKDESVAVLTKLLALKLVESGWKLNTGRGAYVGAVAIGSVGRSSGLQVFSSRLPPKAEHGDDFAQGTENDEAPNDLYEDPTVAHRALIHASDLAIVLDGGRGTLDECELALSARLPVLAATFTGGTARRVTRRTREALVRLGVSQAMLALLDSADDPAEGAERMYRLVNIVWKDWRGRKA